MADPTPSGLRLTLVISALDVGGAARVMATLANSWAEAGVHVTIVQLDWDRPSFFELHPAVVERHLDLIVSSTGVVSAIRNNLNRVRVLRREIRSHRPDVVVSFMDRTNVLVLLAMSSARIPVVVSDRTAGDPTSGRVWRVLRRLTYLRANAIVIQTQGMARDFYREHRSRLTVIPNPAPPVSDPTEITRVRQPGESANLIVALGRLVPQKGYDLLIDAFALIAARRPEARLEIWGAGPERERLEARMAMAGVTERASLMGQTDRPDLALSRADVVAMSSRVEGFPNALLEAMALGKPVVAMDCQYGPSEIVRDGVDGRLVPAGDIVAFANALDTLLGSPEDLERMGFRAREVQERFSMERVLGLWNAVIAELRRDSQR